MFNKTQIKKEYEAPQVRQVIAPVENGFALSHIVEPDRRTNIEHVGNSGAYYTNDIF